MSEYARTFFALTNSMYRLRASEKIDLIENVAIGNADTKDRNNAIDALLKKAKGLHGILQEVKTVKRFKK